MYIYTYIFLTFEIVKPYQLISFDLFLSFLLNKIYKNKLLLFNENEIRKKNYDNNNKVKKKKRKEQEEKVG